MNRSLLTMFVVLLAGAAPASGQIPGLREAAGGLLGRAPSLASFLEEDPAITTSLADALTEVPYLDGWAPADVTSLGIVRRRSDGSFVLHPGAYRSEVQSYCLHAGTHGPGSGDGYLYAPLAGSKAAVVEAILRSSATHPDVPQRDIQVLLWSIIAQTKWRDMGPELQRTARRLLDDAQLDELQDHGLDLLPDAVRQEAMRRLPPLAREVFLAEARLRSALASGAATYGELEQIAVLAGSPPAGEGDRPVPDGRWSYHPEGYFIRYDPHGYSHTTVEISVPGPIAIERDAAGRITTIEEWRGRRLAVGYAGPGSMPSEIRLLTPADTAGRAVPLSAAAPSGAAAADVLGELARLRAALAPSAAPADQLLALAWQAEYCRAEGGCGGAAGNGAPGGAERTLADGSPVYDPASGVATPGQTGRQRLAQSPRCQRDQEALCVATQAALARVGAAIRATASQAAFDAFKQDMATLTEQIAKAACENVAELLEIQSQAAGLSFDPSVSNTPNNLRLVRIENQLKAIAARECGGDEPGDCGPGMRPKTPEDDAALDQVVDGLQKALDQAKETAEALEGQGGDTAQRYMAARERWSTLTRYLGYWTMMRDAATRAGCLPSGIAPLLQRIMENQRSGTESPSECLMLCNLTADWYKQLIPAPSAQHAEAAAREFMLLCARNCW